MDRFLKKTPRDKGARGASSTSPPATTEPKEAAARLTRSGIAPVEVQAEIEKYDKMSEKDKRKHYKCGSHFLTLNDIKKWPDYATELAAKPRSKSSKLSAAQRDLYDKYEGRQEINERVSLLQGDITALEIDAIVNAANNSLLGGGGVDGAIHSAAGPYLKKECAPLKGCETGDAKITHGFKLPAKHVIHTVGPIGECPQDLQSCYERCLELMKNNDLKSIVFPCISTGIYGYPAERAANVALETIRKWLETDSYSPKVERIILCVFLKNDKAIYEDLMQAYFPQPAPGSPSKTDSGDSAKKESAAEGGDKGREEEETEGDQTKPAESACQQASKQVANDDKKETKDTTNNNESPLK